MTELRVDGYTELLRALKKLAPDVDKRVRKELREIANEAAADAKSIAGSFSTRIPGAIGTSVTNRGVGIRVRRAKAPHGSLYELGSSGTRTQVRHPVFGNRDVWATSPTHPFLFPAVKRHEPELVSRVDRALRRAISEVG